QDYDDEDENNRQKSITVKGEIKRRSDTVNSNRRREEKSGSVTRTPSRVKPETELFVTARERGFKKRRSVKERR
ncbi:unnamed protein product, partial [Brassica rapa subsp. trilocularis]